jgi:6-pyruvoyltetrahydropterin/6-carboxytetrahydropterin synthase
MFMYLKRRAVFSAAHSYWLPGLSDAENERLFGQWARREGHGHNYAVELTIGGEIDLQTGMVVNVTDINRVLKTHVLSLLDGRFLNREVLFFQDNAPTLENIARFVWQRVAPELPVGGALTGVRVRETETLWADLETRQNKMQTSLTRAYDFSASHRLHSNALSDEENREIFGKCNNPHGHGHNYEVEVTMTGEPDPRTGMLFPLEELDKIVDEEVLKPFDHKHLNLDTPEFADVNPTSEMLTAVIWEKLARRLPITGSPRLARVGVRETGRNYFEYRNDAG